MWGLGYTRNEYDAFSQIKEAKKYILDHLKNNKPFLLFISFGSPRLPHESAPTNFKKLYQPDSLKLRKNIPSDMESLARKELVGYYGHCTALDSCTGEFLSIIKESGSEHNTIFVFTSDHGQMMCSLGLIPTAKQRPWDESINVTFLLRYPVVKNGQAKKNRDPNLHT